MYVGYHHASLRTAWGRSRSRTEYVRFQPLLARLRVDGVEDALQLARRTPSRSSARGGISTKRSAPVGARACLYGGRCLKGAEVRPLVVVAERRPRHLRRRPWVGWRIASGWLRRHELDGWMSLRTSFSAVCVWYHQPPTIAATASRLAATSATTTRDARVTEEPPPTTMRPRVVATGGNGEEGSDAATSAPGSGTPEPSLSRFGPPASRTCGRASGRNPDANEAARGLARSRVGTWAMYRIRILPASTSGEEKLPGRQPGRRAGSGRRAAPGLRSSRVLSAASPSA